MDIYEQLGVKKLINAGGPQTIYGGSLMPPEVIEAMAEANRAFVNMNELQARAGARIAQLLGVEAALVSAGAAAGMAVAAAACIAGTDPSLAKQLPDTRGLKDEVVILRRHRIHYDQAIRLSGARLVDAGFSDGSSAIEDVAPCINQQTAAILYVAKFEKAAGSVPLAEIVALGRDRGVPVLVDAADELPPLSNARHFLKVGADLVLFSGGKDICGPQASGLILGKKELIEACVVNNCPNYGIGRPMKVSKETIAGLTKAVELYVEQDFEAEWKAWESQRDYVVEQLASVPGVRARKKRPLYPGLPRSCYLPAVYIDLDEEVLGLTADEIVRRLQEGEPSIVVGRYPSGLALRMHMVQEGEEKLLAARLVEILG